MKNLSLHLLLSLLALIALVGCANAENQAAITQTAAAANLANIPPVFFLVDANNIAVPGAVGSWCWNDKCVDQTTPNIQTFLVISEDTIRVRAKSPIPNKFTMTLTQAGGGDTVLNAEVIPDGNTVEWDSGAPAGDYILEIHGEWNAGGNISYFFGVRVGE